MILCCNTWLSVGYATCYVMSSASQCPSTMQPIALETFEAGGGGSDDGGEDAGIACDAPAVSCAATEFPSCCLQDCFNGEDCGLSAVGPMPSCCGGYCGETPIGPDMPPTVTAKCGAGPTMVEGCCDGASMMLPIGFANTSSEWTLGFGEPVVPEASTEASANDIGTGMPIAVPPMPIATPSSPSDGGCAIGRSGSANSLFWLTLMIPWLRRKHDGR